MSLQEEFNTEMEAEVMGLFREVDTSFECIACGGWGEITIEESGPISGCGGYYSGQWFSGYLKCPDCGATEGYSDSSV